MTAGGFRKMALALPESAESAHMGHPDFRVRGKIFDQQAFFVAAHPKAFKPVKGGWGERGATSVTLAAATQGVVSEALFEAWRNVAPKKLAAEHEDE